MEGGLSMNKGSSGFSNYKGSGGGANHSGHNNINSSPPNSISKDRLNHSNKGEYTEHNRPKTGGHGQDSIDYMDKNNIPYEITKEYNNGVRVGNLPTSINGNRRSGNNHTWFPKSWTSQDIADAANYVASTYKGVPSPRTQHTGIFKGVRVTIIFGNSGSISTVFPDKDQGGL